MINQDRGITGRGIIEVCIMVKAGHRASTNLRGTTRRSSADSGRLKEKVAKRSLKGVQKFSIYEGYGKW